MNPPLLSLPAAPTWAGSATAGRTALPWGKLGRGSVCWAYPTARVLGGRFKHITSSAFCRCWWQSGPLLQLLCWCFAPAPHPTPVAAIPLLEGGQQHGPASWLLSTHHWEPLAHGITHTHTHTHTLQRIRPFPVHCPCSWSLQHEGPLQRTAAAEPARFLSQNLVMNVFCKNK